MLLLHQSPRSMVYWKPLEAQCVNSRTQAAGVDPAIPFPLYLILLAILSCSAQPSRSQCNTHSSDLLDGPHTFFPHSIVVLTPLLCQLLITPQFRNDCFLHELLAFTAQIRALLETCPRSVNVQLSLGNISSLQTWFRCSSRICQAHERIS